MGLRQLTSLASPDGVHPLIDGCRSSHLALMDCHPARGGPGCSGRHSPGGGILPFQMMEIGLSFDQLLGGEVDVPIGQAL